MMDKKTRSSVPFVSEEQTNSSQRLPHPRDGSRFHTVIDEQAWSEQAPTAEEQAPRRVRGLPEPEAAKPHPDEPSISLGDSQ